MMGGDDGEPGVLTCPAPERWTSAQVTKAVVVYLAQKNQDPDLAGRLVHGVREELLRPGGGEV